MDYSHIRNLDLLISLDSVSIIILFLEPSKYYKLFKERTKYLYIYKHDYITTCTITIPKSTYDLRYGYKNIMGEILNESKEIKLKFGRFCSFASHHSELPTIIVNEKEVAKFSQINQSGNIVLFVDNAFTGSLITLEIY